MLILKSFLRLKQPGGVRFRGSEFTVSLAATDAVSLAPETSLGASTTLARPAAAMLESGCVPAGERLRAGPGTAVESEKSAALHETAKQRRVVCKFLRGQGRFFQKEPLIILGYNADLIRDMITISETIFENC